MERLQFARTIHGRSKRERIYFKFDSPVTRVATLLPFALSSFSSFSSSPSHRAPSSLKRSPYLITNKIKPKPIQHSPAERRFVYPTPILCTKGNTNADAAAEKRYLTQLFTAITSDARELVPVEKTSTQ